MTYSLRDCIPQSDLKGHIQSLEERLLNQEIRKSREELAGLLADDFIEFGSSGGVANKEQIIEGLLQESPLELSLSDFDIRILAPEVVLATYRSLRHNDGRHALNGN